MRTHLTAFHSHAVQIYDTASGLTAFAFSIPGDDLLLCAKGEVSVKLTAAHQSIPRSLSAWVFLLLAKGMLQPAASIVGEWLHEQQAARESGALMISEADMPLIEQTHNKETDETENQD